MRIRFGISTCPNDTFAFCALLERAIEPRDIELEIELHDVQALNEKLMKGELDGGKASFHAALRLASRYVVLPVGSALGFGVGPVLLARKEGMTPACWIDGEPPRVLCPGRDTTANLLYRLFHPGEGDVQQTSFDRILPALESGETDFGVCIHEARFTYESRGLHLVEDLGARWEHETSAPLPLGGLLARRDLPAETLAELTRAIGASLDWAHEHCDETLPTMRRHAQELQDDVLWQHVDLYVNDTTRDLGVSGRAALKLLDDRARRAGLIAMDAPALHVV